ncbi:MAG: hypothetical protein WEC84_00480 [Candidatus Andersenbacteria bacterium]
MLYRALVDICKPKAIAEQVDCLRKVFPQLSTASALLTDQLSGPDSIAVPRQEKIARSYIQAVEEVLAAINKTPSTPCANCPYSILGGNDPWAEKLIDAQQGDIAVLPLRLCTTTFTTSIVVLTHLSTIWREGLAIACRGDKYNPDFYSTPHLLFREGKVRLASRFCP